MNSDLTIYQLWFRLARVFNLIVRESMLIPACEQKGIACVVPPGNNTR